MIIKTFIFLLLSLTAVQVYAKKDLYFSKNDVPQVDAEKDFDFSENAVPQGCTKEDILHAQGKSPCIMKLKSSQALAEEMGKQFAAYYHQLSLHRNISLNLLKTLQQNHTEYNNRLLELLKEYRIDITQLQETYSSAKRKELCKMYLSSIEKKHETLNALGKSMKAQVAAARDRSLLRAQASDTSDTWYGRIWKWLKNAWHTIERPLFALLGIGIVCQYVYKIGKGIYTWGSRAFLWGRNALGLASQRADIAELTSTTQELAGEGQLGADSQQLLDNLAETLEPNVELAEAADQALANEATSVAEAFEARQAATQAIGTPEASELLEAARAAEVTRAANAAEAIEATQASEIAEAVQTARIAEASEGIGEAAIEEAASVEGAEVAAEVTAEDVLTGVGEAIVSEAIADGAAVAAAEAVAEGAAVAVAEGVAEGAAVAAVGAGVAAPVAIAAVGVVAVGAAAAGIAYVIDPEGTKRFFRNLWNSIRHLFGYY